MVIILLGAPGAGKGTISSELKNINHIVHISTGDIFRKIMISNDETSLNVRKIIESGKLVSDDLTNKILLNELKKHDLNNEIILLDGYPRNITQLNFLKKNCKVDFAFDIYVPTDILIKRVIGRRICPKCNQIFNIYFKKPKIDNKCDFCKFDLIKRKDDNETTIKARFDQYQKVNSQLIDQCKKDQIYYQIDNSKLNIAISKIREISGI